MKKLVLNFIRVAISIGLLVYLILLADLPQIVYLMKNLKPVAVLLAFSASIMSLFFLSIRWYLLIKSYGMKIKFQKLFIFYLIGLFFNNFLPTSIGGDLSRAYYLSRDSGNQSASIGTVFLERIIGLLATLSLAFVSLFWLANYLETKRIVYVTVLLAFFVAFFLAMIMSRRLYRRLNGLISLITFYDIGDKILKVFDTLHFYRDKKIVLIQAYLSSILAQIMLILMNFFLAQGLGLSVIKLGYLFLVVPITFVIGLLPSINGIGVRDTGYLILLARLGLEPSQILSLSFSVTIIPVIISVIGGIIFMVYRTKGIQIPKFSEGKI
jgi:uncharacterized protein (TIRG00374 family)